MSADALEGMMGQAHGHSQNLFYDATNLISRVFRIYEANPDLKKPVDDYKRATAEILSAFVMKSYEQNAESH